MLFTSSFPYGNGEQFLETEIDYLSKGFETVYIIPTTTPGAQRYLPGNCRVLKLEVGFTPQKKIRHYILKNLKTTLRILLFTALRSKDKNRYLSNFKKHLIDLSFEVEVAQNYFKALKEYLKNTEVLYFYWFVNPALHFSILKQQGKLKQKLITRAHGYDYDEQQGRFPIYREFELSQMNYVTPVSAYGLQYFKKRYSNISYRAGVSYLGTNDHGMADLNEAPELHIVSCSAFHPVKRVHLIVDILKEIPVPVKWTHFGSGELENMVRERIKELPAHVTVDLKGQVDNSAVIQFYKTNPVDLFINVSELEGIPVSIMEAISFGIPVMGCNICGVPEIVTTQTGYLLEKEFSPKEAAQKILSHGALSLQDKKEFSKGVKNFWSKTFNAGNNYTTFINAVLKGGLALCAE